MDKKNKIAIAVIKKIGHGISFAKKERIPKIDINISPKI